MKLSKNQNDLMLNMSNYPVGAEKYIATSQYSNSKATGYWSDFVTYCSVQGLRGLEKRGLIEIVDEFWRGASIKRLPSDEYPDEGYYAG